MNFILVDGTICVCTHFTCDQELETQSIGSTKVTVGQSITGEMLLFRQGELPEIFRDDGVVKTVAIEFTNGDEYYTLDDAIFTARRPMRNSYEECEAAYFEYAATDVSVESKDINRKVTI